MKILAEENFGALHALPGDRVELTYKDSEGKVYQLTGADIQEPMVVDRAVVFELEPVEAQALGGARGIGGAFLQRQPDVAYRHSRIRRMVSFAWRKAKGRNRRSG